MPERKSTDEETKIQLKKKTADLIKTLEEHSLLRMLVGWLLPPIVGILVIILFAYYSTSISQPPSVQISLPRIEVIGSDVFTATITVIGLITGFLPIIGFFYIGEIRDAQQEIESSLKEEKKGRSGEIAKLIDGIDYLYDAAAHNWIGTIKKYTAVVVMTSFLSAFTIVWSYISLGIQDIVQSIELFIVIDTFALLLMISGIFPLLLVAIYWPPYKVVRYTKNGRKMISVFPPEE